MELVRSKNSKNSRRLAKPADGKPHGFGTMFEKDGCRHEGVFAFGMSFGWTASSCDTMRYSREGSRYGDNGFGNGLTGATKVKTETGQKEPKTDAIIMLEAGFQMLRPEAHPTGPHTTVDFAHPHPWGQGHRLGCKAWL